jgi:nicotinamide/nicotinate riboside kinase
MDTPKSRASNGTVVPTTPTTAFLLLLSGLSSSGKTTISRHLRSLIPGSFILHEDDFFLADSKIPVTEAGLDDWDCPGAINWEDFGRVLKYVKEHGRVPGDFKSTQEDAEEVGKEKKEVVDDQDGNGKKGLVGEEVLEELRERVEQAGLGSKKVVIVEGFLMFQEESVVEGEADAKMLLRVDYETV